MDFSDGTHEPHLDGVKSKPRSHGRTENTIRPNGEANESLTGRSSSAETRKNGQNQSGKSPLTLQMHRNGEIKNESSHNTGPKVGSMPRPVGGKEKLGTFSGVFVPTTLNVLSILMFLRFGFILGQSGVFGMMGESYDFTQYPIT